MSEESKPYTKSLIRDGFFRSCVGFVIILVLSYLSLRSVSDAFVTAMGVLTGGILAMKGPPRRILGVHPDDGEIAERIDEQLLQVDLKSLWYIVGVLFFVHIFIAMYWTIQGAWWTEVTVISCLIMYALYADFIQSVYWLYRYWRLLHQGTLSE